jgi:hypothetical protein
MKIKVVRDDRPNEEGRWIEVPGVVPKIGDWARTEAELERFVPHGHHLVQVSRREMGDE